MNYDKREFVQLKGLQGQNVNLIRGTVDHIKKNPDGSYAVVLVSVVFNVEKTDALEGFPEKDDAGNVLNPEPPAQG